MNDIKQGWTFGICTDGKFDHRLKYCVYSILKQLIPEDQYEIIIVGNTAIRYKTIKVIPFDESIKVGWITKKKNIIAQESQFNKISFCHDYIEYKKGWMEAYRAFGEDWNVSTNPMVDLNGNRGNDWMIWDDNNKWPPLEWPEYNDSSRLNLRYVPGNYFNVKRDFILKYPLNENLGWGEGEDVEWSKRVRNIWNLRCNLDAKVQYLKKKG